MLSLHRDPPPTAPPPAFNMAAHVLAHADALADKTALSIVSLDAASSWTFGDLARAIKGIAAGLRAAGLNPGDRLLMRLGNEVEFPLSFLGAIWAGIVPIPASAALTIREISKIAEETEPAAIVADANISLPENGPDRIISTGELREMETLPGAEPELGNPNRPAYIVYTSGTSGQPRGVVHAHRSVWARHMMWQDWYALRQEDRLLHAGAFNWTFTLGTGLLDPWAKGAMALIPSGDVSPEDLLSVLDKNEVTLFAAAPGIYRRMLRNPPSLQLQSLRHGLSAGEKLPERLRHAWMQTTGTNVHEALGMSECSTYISGSPRRPAPAGTLGFPQTGRHLAVIAHDGAAVPRGDHGVLAIHRSDPGLMLGYLDAHGETIAPLTDNWFLTGDIVSMREDGAILYHGRDDDMMNAGGFRVSPLEVEAVLLSHPDITDAVCVEVEVKADTNVICAYYSGPQRLEQTKLEEFCAERLAKYKCPRQFRYAASLPRSRNGKIDRRSLRDRA